MHRLVQVVDCAHNLLSLAPRERSLFLLLVLLFKLFFGVAGHFACDSSGWDVATLVSETYAWAYQPPQGCTCEATDVALSECTVCGLGIPVLSLSSTGEDYAAMVHALA